LVNGEFSSDVSVDSGVPQGSVLGPLLFLCHINDLPEWVHSDVRMFADDCLLYRKIKTEDDHHAIQRDLHALEKWASMWGMSFNATKCYVMRVSRKKTPSDWIYNLNGTPLDKVETNPYLGLLLSQDLKPSKHIQKVSKKANNTLSFLRRNLKSCPKSLKETAYTSLVRSVIEYASAVWDPYLDKDKQCLEKIQRRAARFVTNNYTDYTPGSMTNILKQLNWPTLETRRREMRLILFYKIVNGLIAIPKENFIKRNHNATRSTNTLRFNRFSPIPKTDIAKYSFFPNTIIDWNNLKDEIVTAPNIERFKSKLTTPHD